MFHFITSIIAHLPSGHYRGGVGGPRNPFLSHRHIHITASRKEGHDMVFDIDLMIRAAAARELEAERAFKAEQQS